MEDKPKSARSSVRRRPLKAPMAAASSPAANPRSAFNACGHDGCGGSSCNVRYVGPVSHLRDHHALHAARGVAHVWTAAIVSGLAVVITGILAYNAQAATPVRRPAVSPEVRAIMERLDRMEQSVREMSERCMAEIGGGPEEETSDQGPDNAPNDTELMRRKQLMMDEERRLPPPPAGGTEGRRNSPPPAPPAGGSAADQGTSAGDSAGAR